MQILTLLIRLKSINALNNDLKNTKIAKIDINTFDRKYKRLEEQVNTSRKQPTKSRIHRTNDSISLSNQKRQRERRTSIE